MPVIYTTPHCGWAIRNYAALIEKVRPFVLVPSKDESGQKTDDFLAATPLGLTPTMTFGEINIWDSLRINEFLDEIYPPALMPQDLMERAEIRRWIHFCDRHVMPLISRLFRREENPAIAISGIDTALSRMAHDRLFAADGDPYFLGKDFTLIDLAYVSLFDLFPEMKSQFGYDAEDGREWLKSWSASVAARPCVIQAHSVLNEFARHVDMNGYMMPMRVEPGESGFTTAVAS